MQDTENFISPEIAQFFNKDLLNIPTPEFKDSPKTFFRILGFIEKKLKKKSLYGNRMEKYEKYFDEVQRSLTFLQKKENSLPEKKSKAQQPFYYARFAKRGDRELFARLGRRSCFYFSLLRNNYI